MSQFPTQPEPDSLPDVDSLVKANRLKTPKSAVDQRQTPRFSIEELNNMDADQIRDHYMGHEYDDRSPVVKALDLIDLPRNIVANLLFRPGGTVDPTKMRRGAFGLPSISASDALESMGVKNHIVRAIGGLVGDVALDPLTYLGPAGWGLEVADDAGRAVKIAKPGKKALMAGIDAAKSGATHPETADLFGHILANSGKELKGDEAAQYLSKRVFGDAATGDKSVLANSLSDFTAEAGSTAANEAQAARDFVAKHGKYNAPGPSIGGRGSQVAHIPFTGIGLNVPGFTREGRAAVQDFAQATSKAPRPLDEILAGSKIPEVAAITHAIGDSEEAINNHVQATKRVTSDLTEQIAQAEKDRDILKSADPSAVTTAHDAAIGDMRNQLAEHQQRSSLMLRGVHAPTGSEDIATDSMLGRHQDLLTSLHQKIAEGVDGLHPTSPADIFALKRVQNEAEAKYNLLKARADPNYQHKLNFASMTDDEAVADAIHKAMDAYSRFHDTVHGAVQNFAATADETHMMDAAARFLGTDDRVIGRAALSGPDAMTRHLKSDLMDRGSKLLFKTFGQKGAAIDSAARDLVHDVKVGSRRDVATFGDNVFRQIKDAFTASGMTPTSEDFTQALHMLEGYALKSINTDALQKTGQLAYRTTKWGTNEPAEWMNVLEKAWQSGKFDSKMTGKLNDRLQQIARELGPDVLADMRDTEMESGVLKNVRGAYFPLTATNAAKTAIERGQKYGMDAKSAYGRATKTAGAAFNKARSTDYAVWKSADGTEKRLFNFEMDQAKRISENPNELEALRQEGKGKVADSLQALADDYKEFDALRKSQNEGSKLPQWYAASSHEMNQLQRDGRFSILLDGQGDLPDGFMHTNFISSMASRIAAHRVAEANQQWATYTKQMGITAPEFVGKEFKGGAGQEFVAANGARAKVVMMRSADGSPVRGAEIAGRRYRPLKAELQDATELPIIQMIGRDSAHAMYPEQVADKIELIADAMKPDNANALFKALDTVTRQWKSLTLLHPAWSIFNFVGDTLNAIGNRLPLIHFANPKLAKFSAYVNRNADNPALLKAMSVDLPNGQRLTGQEFWDILNREKVIDGTMMQENALASIENGYLALSSQLGGQTGVKKLLPSAMSSDYKEAAQRYAIARGMDTPSTTQKIRAGAYVANDRYANNVLGPWYRVNQQGANYLRSQMFMAYLADGNDAKSAARKVIESQYDYSDVTRTEATVFKRMFPFYSWMRNNGAYQIKTLLDHPSFAASYPKLQSAIEEAIAGDDKVPLQARPNWMRQALATQIGADPESRYAVLLGGGLPAADVFQYLTPLFGIQGAMDFMHYFASGINPVAGTAFNMASGQETFSGRSIGADSMSGDVSALESLRNSIRPLAEYGPGGKVYRAFDQGVGQGVARVLLGGRVQDFSQERITAAKTREFKDKETRIRQAISRAERLGDKGTSLEARGKLMQLYSAMEDAGLPVPKWASKQLTQLR